MRVGAVVPVKDENSLEVWRLQNHLEQLCDKVVVVDHGTLTEAYLDGEACFPPSWWSLHADAGGSHDPVDACRLVDAAAIADFDIVIGSRFRSGARFNGPWRRYARSRVMSALMNTICPCHVDDWTSGMRVFSPDARRVILEHDFVTTGHAHQIESLWVCLRAGLSVLEVPITYHAGRSHMNLARAWEAARLWGHLASSSRASFETPRTTRTATSARWRA